MEILASIIGSPVNALTFFIAAGILFFQMVDRGLIKIGENGTEKIPNWAQRLDSYYNHDTTEKLDLIIKGQDRVAEKLDKMLVDGVRIRKD